MEKTTDRRIRKTKIALREGLLSLMQEKSLNTISIKELTEKVDLNRGTFYLHYTDIYDLAEQIQTEFFEEFYQIMDSHSPDVLKEQPLPLLEDIFTFLDKNAAFCFAMLGPKGDPSFVNRLALMIREKCFDNWSVLFNKDKTCEFEYFYSYMLSGSMGMIKAWMQNGRKETPHEIALLTQNIILQGIEILK